jgi:hypothetical protein
MKMINVDYNVKMGYWASRNNMKEYKIYSDMDVRPHYCEQLVTSSQQQSVANQAKKPQL